LDFTVRLSVRLGP